MKILMIALVIFTGLYCDVNAKDNQSVINHYMFYKDVPQDTGFSNNCTCGINILFGKKSHTLSSTMKDSLKAIAKILRSDTMCFIRISGSYTGSSRRAFKLSWNRVNAVIQYLVQKELLTESRIVFNSCMRTDANVVGIDCDTNDPDFFPPHLPHPVRE